MLKSRIVKPPPLFLLSQGCFLQPGSFVVPYKFGDYSSSVKSTIGILIVLLFVGDMIVYIENPTDSTKKLLEVIN